MPRLAALTAIQEGGQASQSANQAKSTWAEVANTGKNQGKSDQWTDIRPKGNRGKASSPSPEIRQKRQLRRCCDKV